MVIPMKRPSFSAQLAVLWGLVAIICATLLVVVWVMARSAADRHVASAKLQATATCEAVASRYRQSILPADAVASADLMRGILDVVLASAPGVEGGFWSSRAALSQNGFLAYSFPTYQGSGIKRDIPEAEIPLILRTLQAGLQGQQAATDAVVTGHDAVVVAACPIQDHQDMFVWTMTRAQPALGQTGRELVTGLAVVLVGILVTAVAFGVVLRRWKRQLGQLEMALPPRGDGTRLPLVGEPDLDRIVDAFNGYVARAEALQHETARLGQRLAQAERFSVLGKLAAQVAHEIRNPTGAMRLKAENALAGDSTRHQEALRVILEQIGRIETQLTSLLALTQPVRLHVQEADVARWMDGVVGAHQELAQQRRVTLVSTCDIGGAGGGALPGSARFDQEQLRRALDNLLINAIRHAGPGGSVTAHASRTDLGRRPRLRITVSDNGPGVPPEHRDHIFEPFVTGRPDGSGLGLAVVSEIAAAHGGRAWLDETSETTSFVMEVPWQPSS
ncbi:signal transduction histidine kinase [Ralstonia sp. 1138]